MPEQRFFIGPPQSGVERNVKSWLIGDDAYQTLKNAYVWRGTLRKRFGSQLLVDGDQRASRLRVNIGTSAAVSGNLGATVVPGAVAQIGQMFSIGTTIFTVYQDGAMYTTGTATGTFDFATLTVTITGNTENPSTAVYWYPALPVMGLVTFNTSDINDEFPVAFDTQFAYKRASSAWERLNTETVAGDALWTGTNSDFFWGANYRGLTADANLLFVTNFVEADGIRYYNDTTETWTSAAFVYATGGNSAIITSKLIFYFKDRMILLNLKEEVAGVTKSFPNRCRFSQNGSPFEATAWYQAPAAYGKGGFIDAPTEQAIVTAQFLKDRLIVFFERSTYELVYTGNKVLPFVWQKINTELGAESTFSQVPFDDVVLGVGNVGIHASDGASVQRIDDKIPQEVFKVRNPQSGLARVAGIREYREELVYWTFPSETALETYPNRVLVYNYKNGTWAFNDDSITAFGYWQRGTVAESPVWQNIDTAWEEMDGSWGIGSQQLKERFVLAGNQEGFTFFLSGETPTNAEAIQVTNFVDTTNVVTAIDHNLTDQDYVYFSNMSGITSLNSNIYPISVTDSDNFVVLNRAPGSDTYTGGGLISRISLIEAHTKDFNFFNKEGRNIAINRVEFYVDTTANGEIMVIPVASDSNENLSINADGSALNAVLGTSILETKRGLDEPFPDRARAWRSVYFSANGESVQLRFFYSAAQARDPQISRVDFQLNAMLIYAQSTDDR